MLRTLDRYIIREVVPPSLVALLTLTFTLEIQPLINIAEPLIRRGIGWEVTLQMVALTLPQALALTIPMSLLCGVLVALGRLSADSEYRAMQACGVGMTRLLRPILVLGVVFSMASAYGGSPSRRLPPQRFGRWHSARWPPRAARSSRESS